MNTYFLFYRKLKVLQWILNYKTDPQNHKNDCCKLAKSEFNFIKQHPIQPTYFSNNNIQTYILYFRNTLN